VSKSKKESTKKSISVPIRSMQKFDLIIIGSGPAGISTALHLLQRDSSWASRMILLEKAVHPRQKLCAGGITRVGLETLLGLDIQLPLPIPGLDIEEARFIYHDSQVRVRRKPVFLVINRIEFDAYLSKIARQRGAIIHENEPVEEIISREDGIKVITSSGQYLANVVVGADGSKGISRKYLSPEGSAVHVGRLLEVIHAVDASQELISKGRAIFDFSWCDDDLQGYSWVFPSQVNGKPHLNKGVYDARLASHRERANLPSILEESFHPYKSGDFSGKVQGNPLISFTPTRRISSLRFLGVGDAAGVDPLFGEGIGPSLAYGKLAADEIESAFRKEDFSFQRYRFHLLVSPLGRYLLLRWLVAWLSYHLSWSSLYMRLFWVVGRIAAALWREDNWYYPPRSASRNAEQERSKDIIKG
jgi:flavin-dependent dehydrogenase